MPHETHYQILGIHRRASIEVIETAYQRLQRLYQGEYMPVLPGATVDEEPEQARWRRIQLAYDILSSPIHRPIYDDKLWDAARRGPKTTSTVPDRSLLEPNGAWLSAQKRVDGFLFFRVGWSAEFPETQARLEQGIPEADRLYSLETGQWRVLDHYDDLMAELFDNFERADHQPPKDLPRPIYQRQNFMPTIRRTREPWTGWPIVFVIGLVLSIVATLIFPANRQAEIDAQATATAVVIANAARSFVNQGPTPTPVPTPVLVVRAALVFASVHLRSGPGTDFPSLALLDNQQEYLLVGRTVDNSWFVMSAGEQTGWVAAFTVAPTAAIGGLAIFVAGDELPGVVPTPTREPIRLP